MTFQTFNTIMYIDRHLDHVRPLTNAVENCTRLILAVARMQARKMWPLSSIT